MTRILRSGWMIALIGGLSYLTTTVLLWQTKHSEHTKIEVEEEKSAVVGPSWDFFNPEVDQLIADLKEQKIAQDLREQELDAFSVRLHAEKEEIKTAIKAIAKLQAQFDQQKQEFENRLTRFQEEELANLQRQAKIYSSISPESALSILYQLPKEQMLKIFSLMKDSEKALLLETMASQGQKETKLAAELTDQLRLVAPPLVESKK